MPCLNTLPGLLQSTVLVKHVFRLLETAAADHRPVPWVLLENVHPSKPHCSITTLALFPLMHS